MRQVQVPFKVSILTTDRPSVLVPHVRLPVPPAVCSLKAFYACLGGEGVPYNYHPFNFLWTHARLWGPSLKPDVFNGRKGTR